MRRHQQNKEIPRKALNSFAFPLPLDVPVGNTCGWAWEVREEEFDGEIINHKSQERRYSKHIKLI